MNISEYIMNKTIIKIAIGTVVGGILGYLYYYFVGCNGGCPITSNWIISVIYGALFGAIVAIPTKRGKNGTNN
jgi:hypothetical protein